MSTEAKKRPETRKSRIINEFAEVISDLYLDDVKDPSKKAIVSAMVSESLGESASISLVEILTAELANRLDNYFAEICDLSGQIINLPFHYVSKRWYQHRARRGLMPSDLGEVSKFVVVFGNGRTGKAAGVRFVDASEEPDPMLLFSTSKRVEVVNAAILTHQTNIRKVLGSASISDQDAERLEGAMSGSVQTLLTTG